jgi:hypothetical protein
MSNFRLLVAAAFGLAASSLPSLATPSLGLPQNLLAEPADAGSFPLVEAQGRDSGRPLASAPLLLDQADYAGVLRAGSDFQSDVERVTGVRPEIVTDRLRTPKAAVIVGTLGKSALIDSLAKSGKINAASISGKWESFLISTVDKPLPGVEQALVIAGSDKRGTIFGLYELSEQIGVSPWYWWADVPVEHRNTLSIRPGSYVQGPPTVKYRGIFLNDEAPCLSGWTKEKFGGFNQKFYTKVFELLLRLRANYLWPAMWGSAFNEDDLENARLADEFGIVMGTSHHEPMLRAQKEWKTHGSGPWNYATNGAILKAFWAQGIERNKSFESIVTMGMRGDGDKPMDEEGDLEANSKLLEKIVADQREILSLHLNPEVKKIPQLWALYKEVMDYYDHGMRVPEDITLLWCDDNWGNLRRLPTPEERNRAGGAGIYYHFDYVGCPRSYRWLNTNPLPKIWEQMNLAYRFGADRIWIVNVGDLKPMEIPTEFFLRMAWNPEAIPKEKIADFSRRWAQREFGPEHAAEIADLVSKYAKFNGWRKPELVEPDTYSVCQYREAERVSQAWNEILGRAEALRKDLPKEKQDAFYELVFHPIQASANLAEMKIAAALNALFAKQGRASANAQAERVRELFKKDQQISDCYNTKLAGGKWSHMMDQTHIGYFSWDQPRRNVMPAVSELLLKDVASYSVAIEGSPEAWPGSFHEAKLPPFDSLGRQRSFLEVFPEGTQPIAFSFSADKPWIVLTEAKAFGVGPQDRRIWVDIDWQKAPEGNSSGTVLIQGARGPVSVKVSAYKASQEQTRQAQGAFGAMTGPVAIAAQDASKNIEAGGVRWEKIPDYGRGSSAMSIFPVTAASILPPKPAPCLEYPVYLPKAGKIEVDAILGPTLNFVPGWGLRVAVSFDESEPQVLDVFEKPDSSATWEASVEDNARVLHSVHAIAAPGRHTLKITMVDPGVVLEKLILHPSKLPSSYFGPPESAPISVGH